MLLFQGIRPPLSPSRHQEFRLPEGPDKSRPPRPAVLLTMICNVFVVW